MRVTLLVQKGKLSSSPSVMGFPDGSVGKESACSTGDTEDAGSIPGSGRSPGEGMTTHSSILAWEISWTQKPGGLLFVGSQRVGHK